MRMSVAFPERNVKFVASHGGISIGEDGASQMAIEDVALTTSLPGFSVIVPADEFSTKALVREMAKSNGPAYCRTGRPKVRLVYSEKDQFKIDKAVRLREGKQVTLVANGMLVAEALDAAEALEKEGISASVIDMHTVKPLDEAALLEEAKKTGHFVVCEEHQIWGGLGSAVSRFLSQKAPSRIEFVAIQDTYAESGKPYELIEHYGLTAPYILEAAKRVLKN